MNRKQLTLVVVLAAVLGGLALVMTRRQTATEPTPDPLDGARQ